MSTDLDIDDGEKAAELLEKLSEELKELYTFRDMFFENHSIELASEKNKLVDEKKEVLMKKFDVIDDSQIPTVLRAKYFYMKGRCYNINSAYDARATQCLSKAVKLNPHLTDAWNELGECYWKNLNLKDAKASFEGALKHERNALSLRCLSIILRQEVHGKTRSETTVLILKSVELAKDAVALNIKDGLSWSILGNAYLCQYFMMVQDPTVLKAAMSAYKQAYMDPIAKGHPDLYYNRGIALKYDESYNEALDSFATACRLEPAWACPRDELAKLRRHLAATDELVRTRGKLNARKLKQILQHVDQKMLGDASSKLRLTRLDALQDGANAGKVVLGRVVGSIRNENSVPFTFAVVDESMQCVCVNVYNWADGRGAIIGDAVAIPEPVVKTCEREGAEERYSFKSIRINNPTNLYLNGKQISRHQFASTRVTSTYEIH